ncbi:hypothetical protein GYMLUDRAFT_33156 [Collybiopsis luxurians FD-317 M1]|nr:hypothetical protein GYMLUDRAFT_33156 [Collybiopsis luxurians FD-317 M1]
MSGVASKNPFALLDEGNSRPSSPTPAPSKAPPAPPVPAKPQAQKSGPRGGKYYQRGGARSSTRADGNPNQNGVEEAEAAPRKFENRGRGRGGARGGRGVRRDRPDRHSATGKTDSDKKIHQGWGGDDGNTELQAEAAATVDAAAEQAWGTSGGNEASAWDTPTTGGETAVAPAATEDKPERENRRREEEEEDNTLTLDQYLAQKKEKEASVLPEKPQVRQANEGAGGDIWKDAVAIQKGGDEEAYFAGKGKAAHKARAKKEEKVYIEIDGRFANDRPRGGRGRGGDRGRRGGPERGRGGGRGGGRQNSSAQAKVDVDDQEAFPSLS